MTEQTGDAYPLSELKNAPDFYTPLYHSICALARTGMFKHPDKEIFFLGQKTTAGEVLIPVADKRVGLDESQTMLVNPARWLDAYAARMQGPHKNSSLFVAKNHRPMPGDIATPSPAHHTLLTFEPLKGLIDDLAAEKSLPADLPNLYRDSLKNISRSRAIEEGPTPRYVLTHAGHFLDNTCQLPIATVIDRIEDCYFDPRQQDILAKQIGANLDRLAAGEATTQTAREAAQQRLAQPGNQENSERARKAAERKEWRAQKEDLDTRYIKLDTLLRIAGRGDKEAKGIASRLSYLLGKNRDGNIFYHGTTFEKGDIVIHASLINPVRKDKVKQHIYVTPDAAEKLVSLLKGEVFRLPKHLPADFYSDLHMIPGNEDTPSAMPIKSSRGPLR